MRKYGFLLTTLGVFIMSFESSLIKYSKIGGFEFLFYFGLFLFIATFFINPATKYQNTKYMLLSSSMMALSNVCFIFAVKLTGIAVSVIILATSPICCAIFDILFTKKKTPKILYIVTITVIIGLLITLKNSDKIFNILGITLAFLTVFFLAICYVILTNFKSINRFSQISFAGLFMCLIGLIFCNFDSNWHDIIPVAIMGFIITPISRAFIGMGTKYILSSEVGLLIILESILAPIWGKLFLNETITINMIIGAILIILSILFYTFKQKD